VSVATPVSVCLSMAVPLSTSPPVSQAASAPVSVLPVSVSCVCASPSSPLPTPLDDAWLDRRPRWT
jgi:hypothetical protein